ncbi:hypothetical protein GCM10009769_02000 [Curtobacterium luteum]|uniref:Uncharacterized protein n=1 Tax=Curtobacterium luteum TaxID=33881 RepID=A0A8H9L108_9MICO|nr:hypothetical protein GCM10009769_02000 [Curtobacterium luteum]
MGASRWAPSAPAPVCAEPWRGSRRLGGARSRRLGGGGACVDGSRALGWEGSRALGGEVEDREHRGGRDRLPLRGPERAPRPADRDDRVRAARRPAVIGDEHERAEAVASVRRHHVDDDPLRQRGEPVRQALAVPGRRSDGRGAELRGQGVEDRACERTSSDHDEV